MLVSNATKAIFDIFLFSAHYKSRVGRKIMLLAANKMTIVTRTILLLRDKRVIGIKTHLLLPDETCILGLTTLLLPDEGAKSTKYTFCMLTKVQLLEKCSFC